MSSSPKSFYQVEMERLYDALPLRPEHYAQVRRSRALMLQEYGSQLQLTDLAKSAFMSKFHYVRMFQRIYGVTPRTYLRDLRMRKAKALLTKGMPVTDVCFEVGYQSVTTFSSIFKKCIGQTPTSFRQIIKSNPE
ncbi:helix-turn-helix transcriptional regulator [Ferrimonas aestuarii]|uniref:Helix-turn-helix transcriptional regulator n=2 Tax=Ferrimonas aestuarii TaxID=2569539 RepID=A0A4U1BRM1_9GAMM|nr:helix-turn-helix transcriptional regulator [Ferrimonas aestuarii]